MVEINQIFYVSLVVRKIKVFVGSPNFQLNNCIRASLCSYFLTYHQFFVKLLWYKSALGLRLIFHRTLYHLKVIHNVEYSLLCP